MNKYEEAYLRAAKDAPRASWKDTAVNLLAADLAEATGEPVVISGPYGLRAEVVLYVGHNEEKKTGKCITLTPYFNVESGEFHICYDTGKVEQKYAAGGLGDFNGFNNETALLPDTLDEIIGVLKDMY